MAWTPMYLEKEDVDLLIDWLNGEDGIAYIVNTGPFKWKAVDTYEYKEDVNLSLWHKPGGRLPLITEENKMEYPYREFIDNPYNEWRNDSFKKYSEEYKTVPYFGNCLWVMTLDLHVVGRVYDNNKIPSFQGYSKDILGMSCFGWIGNHYSAIGREWRAPESTKKWWERKTRWIRKVAKRVPRYGTDFRQDEIYAFPYALRSIKSGKPRNGNPD